LGQPSPPSLSSASQPNRVRCLQARQPRSLTRSMRFRASAHAPVHFGLVERCWCPCSRSLCALMRFISSSSASISSSRRSFLDFSGSALRIFCSAFSTDSLGVSAMASLGTGHGGSFCRAAGAINTVDPAQARLDLDQRRHEAALPSTRRPCSERGDAFALALLAFRDDGHSRLKPPANYRRSRQPC